MDSPRLTEAEELRDRIEAALEPIAKATATLNFEHVASGARHGVALITPPALKFPSAAVWEAEWPVHLIAGPARDPIAAWAKLDALLQAVLGAGLPVTKAEASSFASPQGENLPAYTITING